jgi:hypothetical protein
MLPLFVAAQDFSIGRPIIPERHDAPGVSFHINIKAGSVFEPPAEIGSARMLERLAFNGSERLGSVNILAEKKAFDAAYPIDAQWAAAHGLGGIFAVEGAIQGMPVTQTLRAIHDEIGRMEAEEVSESELDIARSRVLDRFR